MRLLLIGSLAVNLPVLGLVTDALIRSELQGREALQKRPQRDRNALISALLVALRAETYDPVAAKAALDVPWNRAGRATTCCLAGRRTMCCMAAPGAI